MITIGPRVLKTGLAVTLAIYLTDWLGLDPPLFAAIAAAFTIQPSIYRSWKQVLEQFQANTLGAVIAVSSIYLFGNNPFVTGLVVVIVIVLSLKLNMESSISLTIITVLVIMSSEKLDGLVAAGNKFLIVLIGMVSALIINLLISPPSSNKNFVHKMESGFKLQSLLIRTAISNELKESTFQKEWNILNLEVKKLEELYNILDEERKKLSKIKHLDIRELVVFKQMLNCLKQGLRLLDIIEDHFFQNYPDKEGIKLFDNQLEELIHYHEMSLLKYSGKIRKVSGTENGNNYVNTTMQFLENLQSNPVYGREQKFRLMIIGSAIYDYAYQLERLNELIDHYQK